MVINLNHKVYVRHTLLYTVFIACKNIVLSIGDELLPIQIIAHNKANKM